MCEARRAIKCLEGRWCCACRSRSPCCQPAIAWARPASPATHGGRGPRCAGASAARHAAHTAACGASCNTVCRFIYRDRDQAERVVCFENMGMYRVRVHTPYSRESLMKARARRPPPAAAGRAGPRRATASDVGPPERETQTGFSNANPKPHICSQKAISKFRQTASLTSKLVGCIARERSPKSADIAHAAAAWNCAFWLLRCQTVRKQIGCCAGS